jgi:transketolase
METKQQLIDRIVAATHRMRETAVRCGIRAAKFDDGAHFGPGLSCIEITATLYLGVLHQDPTNPSWPDRDRFIMSKGHGILGYYTALAEAGYFTHQFLLDNYETDNGPFCGHPCRNLSYGIETSTGSLGHGLSIGTGIALTAKLDHKTFDTYVLLGDGECNEGSVWEAVMLANQYKLDNLIAIVDRNKLQSDGLSREIIDMEPLTEKWRSFGWQVEEVNGHNPGELLEAFHRKNRPMGRPYVVIAHTTKGKGVSMFEDNNKWHHKKISSAEAEQALEELGAGTAD